MKDTKQTKSESFRIYGFVLAETFLYSQCVFEYIYIYVCVCVCVCVCVLSEHSKHINKSSFRAIGLKCKILRAFRGGIKRRFLIIQFFLLKQI